MMDAVEGSMMGIQATFDAIVRGHRVVRDSTRLIAGSEDPQAILEAMRELADVLPGHFSAEEGAHGYFDHLRRVLHKGAEAQVLALVDDHRYMEAELGVLLDDPPLDAAWVARARRFAQHLREHEQVESRLGATADADGLR